MVRLFFISLIAVLPSIHAFGQKDFLLQPDKTLPADDHWLLLQHSYNAIPIDKLKVAEEALDSIISASDCYKFIHNADFTRFLAFFIQHKDAPSHRRLARFGQVVHRHYRPSEANSINYYAYVLWGMKYNDTWYYHKAREHEFWDKDDKSAKNDFLYHVLTEIGFLYKTDKEAFWKQGGVTNQFRIIPKNSSYLEEYAGLPEIVGWHKKSHEGRQNQMLNEKIEALTCRIQTDLWNRLQRSDSLLYNKRYKGQYMNNHCMVLYNSDRTKVLLPMLYLDKENRPWLEYYFLKIDPADTTLYLWTKLKAKKINRPPGETSLEIVYDIRTFLEGWNWGTVNMISTENFWTDNFSDADLKFVKKEEKLLRLKTD